MSEALNLQEQREVSEALATFQSLQVLDATWTGYLKDSKAVPKSDVAELRLLTNRMKALLHDAEQQARQLERVLRSRSAELEQRYEKALSDGSFPQEHVPWLRAKVQEAGGISKFGADSAAAVAQLAPGEADLLTSQMGSLDAGGTAAGDLTKSFVCKVYAGMMAGGLVTGQPEVAGLGLLGAVLTGC